MTYRSLPVSERTGAATEPDVCDIGKPARCAFCAGQETGCASQSLGSAYHSSGATPCPHASAESGWVGREDTYHGRRKRRAPSLHSRWASGVFPSSGVPNSNIRGAHAPCAVQGIPRLCEGGGSTRKGGLMCLWASAFQTEDSVPLCWIRTLLELCLTVRACCLSSFQAFPPKRRMDHFKQRQGLSLGQFRTFRK